MKRSEIISQISEAKEKLENLEYLLRLEDEKSPFYIGAIYVRTTHPKNLYTIIKNHSGKLKILNLTHGKEWGDLNVYHYDNNPIIPMSKALKLFGVNKIDNFRMVLLNKEGILLGDHIDGHL